MLNEEGLIGATSAHPRNQAVDGARRPRLTVRLRARLRWFSLDERLIAGEDPSGSELLTAHAARLTSPRSREAIATGLAALVRAAEQPARISRVSPDRAAVLANRGALEDLAESLEERPALYAPGVARLERLLTDSAGPAFTGGVKALAEELAHAAAELAGATSLEPDRSTSGGKRQSRPFRIAPRRFDRFAPRGAPGSAIEPPGFVGGSFSLPDGSWFHGRRDS